jgi:hypothetical protein
MNQSMNPLRHGWPGCRFLLSIWIRMRLEMAKYKKNAMLRQQEENTEDVV